MNMVLECHHKRSCIARGRENAPNMIVHFFPTFETRTVQPPFFPFATSAMLPFGTFLRSPMRCPHARRLGRQSR